MECKIHLQLLSVPGKVMCRVILEKLREALDKLDKVHDSTKGFYAHKGIKGWGGWLHDHCTSWSQSFSLCIWKRNIPLCPCALPSKLGQLQQSKRQQQGVHKYYNTVQYIILFDKICIISWLQKMWNLLSITPVLYTITLPQAYNRQGS